MNRERSSNDRAIRLAIIYLVIQAIAGCAWWTTIVFSAEARRWFLPHGAADWVLLGYWLADAVFFIGGSLLTAALLHRRSARTPMAAGMLAGAVGYAALTCLAVSLWTRSAWLATALMMPAAICCTAIAIVASPRSRGES